MRHVLFRLEKDRYALPLASIREALLQSDEILKFFTERAPLRRYAQPDEIAGAALYLASDAASFVTGHTLVVDGGFSIS